MSTVNKIALTIIIRSAMAIGAISLKRKLFTMEFCLLFLPAGESRVKKFQESTLTCIVLGQKHDKVLLLGCVPFTSVRKKSTLLIMLS